MLILIKIINLTRVILYKMMAALVSILTLLLLLAISLCVGSGKKSNPDEEPIDTSIKTVSFG